MKNEDTLLGKDGVLTPLLKEFLEGALDDELEAHIEDEGDANRKNGKGRKQVKTAIGSVDINPPRDRNGTFEPEIIPQRMKPWEWTIPLKASIGSCAPLQNQKAPSSRKTPR
ncbi:transposase [Chitinophaga oryzae]|uniref:Mutator family transposase n=1 Tax=Chitinophaga oryzae TaxID=2725414 RepID=A0AAE7DAH6_9BACT|nr:transposase [Chitinophaga oryzae]QJB35911.1 transposase [Chitinophaga oryzae]